MENIIEYLEKRGAIDEKSSDDLAKFFAIPRSFYVGFDPTASSLHLGNLVGIVLAKAFQNHGHKPYILIGGATARIGDPSGKLVERAKLDEQEVEKNIQEISRFFHGIFPENSDENSPVILNNYSWFSPITFIEFLRDTGRYFRLSTMLAKESVKTRLQSPEGMSFCEFSYQVLQAYDFYHLFQEKQIAMQVGGSDQWGNMTAGIELIRKKEGKKVHAMTFPLLVGADGKKLGKTEKGATWLAKEKMSPYAFYQDLIKTSDQDVIKLLKMLTFLPVEEIQELEKSMTSSSYVPNTAQKKLAEEITRFVHGEEGLQKALGATKTARPGSKALLTKEALEEIAGDIPSVEMPPIAKEKFSEVALKAGLVSSKSEAVRLVKNGGAYINNEKVEDPLYVFEEKDLIGGTFVLLSAGKKRRVLLKICP